MKEMKETSGKIEEISGKIWENNVKEIPDKIWIKFTGNFDRIIPNKVFIEFTLVEHLKKILKTLNFGLFQV